MQQKNEHKENVSKQKDVRDNYKKLNTLRRLQIAGEENDESEQANKKRYVVLISFHKSSEGLLQRKK